MIDQDDGDDTVAGVAAVKDSFESSGTRKVSRARQRWSLMYLARTADTESINTAKKEKMQVIKLQQFPGFL